MRVRVTVSQEDRPRLHAEALHELGEQVATGFFRRDIAIEKCERFPEIAESRWLSRDPNFVMRCPPRWLRHEAVR